MRRGDEKAAKILEKLQAQEMGFDCCRQLSYTAEADADVLPLLRVHRRRRTPRAHHLLHKDYGRSRLR
jgi:hypothetical protein